MTETDRDDLEPAALAAFYRLSGLTIESEDLTPVARALQRHGELVRPLLDCDLSDHAPVAAPKLDWDG